MRKAREAMEKVEAETADRARAWYESKAMEEIYIARLAAEAR